MVVAIEKVYWHPGFYGTMEVEFIRYNDLLQFNDEEPLSKEPLRMDLMIIKKDTDIRITNQIGDLFRKYNIIEYKSPGAGFTIDDYCKAVGYAYLYKGLGKTVNEIPLNELTVTFIREAYPREMFRTIRESGGKVEEKFPGVYYIHGIVNLPTQVIVTRKLDKSKHPALRVLSRKVTEEDAENFINMVKKFREPGDRRNADAILQVSMSANRDVYEKLKRRKPDMCEALRELMKDEIVKS